MEELATTCILLRSCGCEKKKYAMEGSCFCVPRSPTGLLTIQKNITVTAFFGVHLVQPYTTSVIQHQ